MPKMLRELDKQPEIGLLGYRQVLAGPRSPMVIQYWRSFEQLEAYARSKDSVHFPAWVKFNKTIGSNGDVGIWHETFKVAAGQYEAVYNNMSAIGLGKVGGLVSATGYRPRGRGRLPGGEFPPPWTPGPGPPPVPSGAPARPKFGPAPGEKEQDRTRPGPGRPPIRPGGPPREVPSGARQAPPRRRQRPVPRGQGRLRPLRGGPLRRAGFTRAPLTDEVEVAVIGGGFGGLLAAPGCARRASRTSASSRRAATSAAPGTGTAIPGAACDIESYIYLPLLEETGYIPTEKYAKAPEILEHSRRIGRALRPLPDALFQTEVTELRWDEDAARWIITTDRGDRFRARSSAWRTGRSTGPKLPGIPGHRDVQGPHVPHQPLGLRLHRRRQRRQPHRPGRQARRHHRHGRHGGPVRAARRRAPASSSSSSARRRRSTCAPTGRPTRPGRSR